MQKPPSLVGDHCQGKAVDARALGAQTLDDSGMYQDGRGSLLEAEETIIEGIKTDITNAVIP